MHGVIPSLSRVAINLPSVHLFSSGPIWNLESLENRSWSSVETNISYSFNKGRWMEVLSIHMEHEVGLFVELLDIEVLDSNTYIIIINLN